MSKELFIRAITRFIAGVILLGVLLFAPAGTFRYPQAWIFMGILFIPMFGAGLVMMAKNPELLEKRLSVKEKESGQLRRRGHFPFRLRALRGSAQGEYLPFKDRRSSGKSEGGRHRSLRDCPPPNVHDHAHYFPDDAAYSRLRHIICNHVGLLPDYYKENQE